MKIVIPGGSGQVGTLLARALHGAGHEVVVLSRTPQAAPWRQVAWDAATLGVWAAELDGADAVINLAGRSVNCRYTPANRAAIMGSRVRSTEIVGHALGQCARPPRVWLQASTATIYAHRFDAPHDEITGEIGAGQGAPDTWRFSVDVARSWERAATRAHLQHTRLVLMRSAIVLSPGRGGIFDTLLGMVRLGLGGPVAGGGQYVSWLHGDDFVRAALWLIERDDLAGPVNLAAPFALPQRDFMRALCAAWGARVALPATAWMAEVGALALGTETELILKSRYVAPARLIASGFSFQHPEWPAAARDLCRRWREGRP